MKEGGDDDGYLSLLPCTIASDLLSSFLCGVEGAFGGNGCNTRVALILKVGVRLNAKIDLTLSHVQGLAKKWAQGLVNFDPGVAYNFCLILLRHFLQLGDHFLTKPCTVSYLAKYLK